MYAVKTVAAARATLTARFSPRIAITGFAIALLTAAGGAALERVRLGADDAEAATRVQADVERRFEAATTRLAALTADVIRDLAFIQRAASDSAAAPALFDRLDALIPDEARTTTGLTVYAEAGAALAWAGRVSEIQLQPSRVASLAIVSGGPGPRLVRVEPVFDNERAGAARVAVVVAEEVLGPPRVATEQGDRPVLTAGLAPVTLILPDDTPGPDDRFTFPVVTDDGRTLLTATVKPEDLAAARARWRGLVAQVALGIVGFTLLLATAPLVDLWRGVRTRRAAIATALVIALLLIASRAVLWLAARWGAAPSSPTSPINLLTTALLVGALTWLLLDMLERLRVERPGRALRRAEPGVMTTTAAVYGIAGALSAWLMWRYSQFLLAFVGAAPVDFLHVSLAPLTVDHLARSVGLVLLHAGVFWFTAGIMRTVQVLWRHERATVLSTAATAGWIAGAIVVLLIARSGGVTAGPLMTLLAAIGLGGLVLNRPRGPVRRLSQAARLALLAGVIVVPALAVYPTLHAGAVAANERLLADEYGPQAAYVRDDLQEQLRQTLEAIDRLPPATLVARSGSTAAPSTDEAFRIWNLTDLATLRLKSAVELYTADGRLASRFALLPEYAPTSYEEEPTCDWDTYDEASPFGVNEPHVLRASRGICDNGRRLGAIVVRAMLDYRSLPFVAMEDPYLESLRPAALSTESQAGHDVELVVYGWSRRPIFASATNVWRLPDDVFQRLVDSREPFWESVVRDNRRFRVHFRSDRGAIYAVGYPVLTGFDHLVNLAEILTLALLVCACLVGGAAVFGTLTSGSNRTGRALLREVRSSFYRKLFLAFVAMAVVPVVILAIAVRAYVADQARGGVEEAARQTAMVAQRLVEDYATLQQREPGAPNVLDDQVMVLVGRATDQVVNLFLRDRLQATSARDMFASGLVSTRTPAEVHRDLVLYRMPTFVGEEVVGGLRYLLAAAPVRAGGFDGLVTVPQTLRRRESEREIAELDRSVLFASALFVMVGAGLGYWMAERIADPVSRLTRATRRIARGDLDARIAATSSDELRRLVEDFNRMAADLKRQRTELERTQRLEAWADMARQVAHDIKNPLTPIQLSAEHARRVNLDRGAPLSPALDRCVDAILTQVTLLRQIAAEFSSFASSPTPRPEPTDLADVITEVVEPYRAGLAERITIQLAIASDLPSLTIDRTLFARALTNIVENALHAMGGRGTLTIEAARQTTATSDVVAVVVSDTGVGMDAADLARIFEPYFSTRAAGTGLGLTIAKRNVDLNGGTIGVTSVRGEGTRVTIALPVLRPVAH